MAVANMNLAKHCVMDLLNAVHEKTGIATTRQTLLIGEASTQNFSEDEKLVALVAASGLPVVDIGRKQQSCQITSLPTKVG